MNIRVAHLQYLTIIIQLFSTILLLLFQNTFGFSSSTLLFSTMKTTTSSLGSTSTATTSESGDNNVVAAGAVADNVADVSNSNEPRWCPEQQIYIGGVPENAQVTELIEKSNGYLRLFGYGSLCWNRGTGALARSEITETLGKARGYQRCWAQKSTDHRGTTKFPGIVCTLLKDSEVQDIIHIRRQRQQQQQQQQSVLVTTTKTSTSIAAETTTQTTTSNSPPTVDTDDYEPTMTEGVIYLIPPDHIDDCLEELDFREKGGYARDVIDVIENDTGELHQALLYRGTPDSPAIWPRALLDLPFAAAIMSVADGPSGRNDVYLNSLDEFLSKVHTAAANKDDTKRLATMAKQFQTKYQPFFLFGSGSNQHNQLLLDRRPNNAANLYNGEDAHDKKEILVCTVRSLSTEQPKDETMTTTTVEEKEDEKPKAIYAGGGHSGLLTTFGKFYLWGWNDSGQCAGSSSSSSSSGSNPLGNDKKEVSSIPLVSPFADIQVEDAALGFSHTLVIEKDTKKLFAFGSNERGQVNGIPSDKEFEPVTPDFLKDEKIKSIAAGLFHSAVVTMNGELITFGCGRFGQCMSSSKSSSNSSNNNDNVWINRWKPDDGTTKVVDVICGRRHTVVLDEKCRIWTFGENKYGQLGRPCENKKFDPVPALVDNLPEDCIPKDCTKIHLSCGWSHNIVHVESSPSSSSSSSKDGTNIIFGWGRNDRGQLGIGTSEASVTTPRRLFLEHKEQIKSVVCSSESTLVLDHSNQIYGCGWNEHGNLATGGDGDDDDLSDKLELVPTMGETVVGPSGFVNPTVMIAAGGAHFLAGMMEG